jgi:hypothetical protein
VAETERAGVAPTVVAVLREKPGAIERFKAPLLDKSVNRTDVEDDLSAVLHAAAVDGLIREPTNPLTASWA